MFHNKDRSSRHRSGSQILMTTSQLPTAVPSNKRTEAVFKIEDTLTKTKKMSLQDLLLFQKVQNSNNYANNSSGVPSISNNNNNNSINNNVYTVYVIRVTKPYSKRSWLVLRRYREFHELHKYLTKQYEQSSGAINAVEVTKNDRSSLGKSNFGQRVDIPPIPPKLVFGNMKETNITKRLNGLQAFLNGLSQQHDVFCEDSEVIKFFNLDKDKQAIIYQLSDSLHRKIFQFLSFTDIFPLLTNVCKWWFDIIYSSFQSVKLVNVGKFVFFGNVPINIKTIEEGVSFITKFKSVTILRLEQFYELKDEMLNIIFENCYFIEELILVSCGLEQPTIPLTNIAKSSVNSILGSNIPNEAFASNLLPLNNDNGSSRNSATFAPISSLRYINLSYCELLNNVTFSNLNSHTSVNQNLVELDLTGTSITDQNLSCLLTELNYLKVLLLKECRHLIKPKIKNDSIEHLNLRFCRNLVAIRLQCPLLSTLDLAYTSITDEAIERGITSQTASTNLRILSLSNCRRLIEPKFVQSDIQHRKSYVRDQEQEISFVSYARLEELYLDCCPFLKKPVIKIDKLKLLDLRITKQLDTTEVTREKLLQSCSSLINGEILL
jgi:hypothetical protein